MDGIKQVFDYLPWNRWIEISSGGQSVTRNVLVESYERFLQRAIDRLLILCSEEHKYRRAWGYEVGTLIKSYKLEGSLSIYNQETHAMFDSTLGLGLRIAVVPYTVLRDPEHIVKLVGWCKAGKPFVVYDVRA